MTKFQVSIGGKRFFRVFGLVWGLGALGSGLWAGLGDGPAQGCWAAQQGPRQVPQKKLTRVELYAATEGLADGEAEWVPASRTHVGEKPRAVPRIEPRAATAVPSVSRLPVGESVPTVQIAYFEQRLEWVGKLLRDFGKAYDYRSLTLLQLKQIYESHRATVESQVPAPAPETESNPAPEVLVD